MQQKCDDIPAVVHVYTQFEPHDNVVVCGNTRGLTMLTLAAQAATGSVADFGPINVMTNDGERYFLTVECDDSVDEKGKNGMVLPHYMPNRKPPYSHATQSASPARGIHLPMWGYVTMCAVCGLVGIVATKFLEAIL